MDKIKVFDIESWYRFMCSLQGTEPSIPDLIANIVEFYWVIDAQHRVVEHNQCKGKLGGVYEVLDGWCIELSEEELGNVIGV